MTITSFFEILGNGITGAATAFGNLFSGIIPVFWTAGTGESPGTPTMLTIFIIATIALTLGLWGIDKLISLAKLGLGGTSKARAKKSRKGA